MSSDVKNALGIGWETDYSRMPNYADLLGNTKKDQLEAVDQVVCGYSDLTILISGMSEDRVNQIFADSQSREEIISVLKNAYKLVIDSSVSEQKAKSVFLGALKEMIQIRMGQAENPSLSNLMREVVAE